MDFIIKALVLYAVLGLVTSLGYLWLCIKVNRKIEPSDFKYGIRILSGGFFSFMFGLLGVARSIVEVYITNRNKTEHD